ncbi:MAG: tetratricopeptide repeat protein [Magnetococcales bacterium]|nr:tetratricopeptide repeat protein [Magnetococcales bacterium]
MSVFIRLVAAFLVLCSFSPGSVRGQGSDALLPAQNRLIHSETEFGPEHLNTAVALQGLAELYGREKKWEKAAPLLERALTIRTKTHGLNHPLVFRLQTTLAGFYLRMGRRSQGVELLERVLKLARDQFGDTHLETAQAQVDLAQAYGMDSNRVSEAVRLVTEALPVLHAELWRDHPRVSEALIIKAQSELLLGHLSAAEQSLSQALAIRESNFGSDHPKVAEVLLELGRLQGGMGNLKQAESRISRSLSIFRRLDGEQSLSYANSLEHLSELLVFQARYDEARPLLEQVVAIQEKVRGRDHPRLIKWINDLALVQMKQQRFVEAKKNFARSQALALRHFGSENIQIAFILGNISEINRIQGREREAEEQFDRSVRMAETVFSGDDLGLSNWLSSVAVTLHKSGNPDKAGQLFKRSLQLIERSFGPDHPQVRQVRQSLQALQVPLDPVGQSKNHSDLPVAPSTPPETLAGEEAVTDWNRPIQESEQAMVESLIRPPNLKTVVVVEPSQKPVDIEKPSGSAATGRLQEETVSAPVSRVESPNIDPSLEIMTLSVSDTEPPFVQPWIAADSLDAVARPGVRAEKSIAAAILAPSMEWPIDAESVQQAKERIGLSVAAMAKDRISNPQIIPDGSISAADKKSQSVIEVGCFLPVTKQPLKLMKQLELLDLPVYQRASIINRQIHSCLFIGPFFESDKQLAERIQRVSTELGLTSLSISTAE